MQRLKFLLGRPFWMLLGFVSLACGLVGVVLPLVPTTPFLLLSAVGFARSSPRLHRWLVTHPRLGPPIENWHRHGSISRGTKVVAVVFMAAALGGSVAFDVTTWVVITQAVVLSVVALFILTRPDGPPS